MRKTIDTGGGGRFIAHPRPENLPLPAMPGLHVVSIHIPHPPDYGGAIDEFYRLRTLKQLGIDVTLHCFLYGTRSKAPALEEYCSEVFYYKRAMTLPNALQRLPFIVLSRRDPQLLQNLQRSDDPILFEGIHTCAYIGHEALRHRRKLVRMHNVEWGYYHYLSLHEPNPVKRLYFQTESRKLKRFEETVFHHAQVILPISLSDTRYFDDRHEDVYHLPPFHGFDSVEVRTGTGNHVLIHGDFRILDNARAAMEVALASAEAGMPCIVAGKSPSASMRRKLSRLPNIELMADVPHASMVELMRSAQVHVIQSGNPSGFKIKLLNALYSGRHVLVQREIMEGEELEVVTRPFTTFDEMQHGIRTLRNVAVTNEDIARRESVLLPRFSNLENARHLINLIVP